MRDTWPAPKGGWPNFGPDGKRIPERDGDPVEDAR